MSGQPTNPAPSTGACLSCEIDVGQKTAPGGVILETSYFHAHQDYSVNIPGFVFFTTKRHGFLFDEFTSKEAAEYGSALNGKDSDT